MHTADTLEEDREVEALPSHSEIETILETWLAVTDDYTVTWIVNIV
jgi:hypothetical protein